MDKEGFALLQCSADCAPSQTGVAELCKLKSVLLYTYYVTVRILYCCIHTMLLYTYCIAVYILCYCTHTVLVDC